MWLGVTRTKWSSLSHIPSSMLTREKPPWRTSSANRDLLQADVGDGEVRHTRKARRLHKAANLGFAGVDGAREETGVADDGGRAVVRLAQDDDVVAEIVDVDPLDAELPQEEEAALVEEVGSLVLFESFGQLLLAVPAHHAACLGLIDAQAVDDRSKAPVKLGLDLADFGGDVLDVDLERRVLARKEPQLITALVDVSPHSVEVVGAVTALMISSEKGDVEFGAELGQETPDVGVKAALRALDRRRDDRPVGPGRGDRSRRESERSHLWQTQTPRAPG